MSTRSGKRIHSTVDDDAPADEETGVQIERKTRSKKQKENLEASSKKKNNYVSYPSEEANNTDEGTDNKEKKRRTRRYTLKEHNIDVPVADVDNNNEIKTVRKSRRGKKVVEEATEKADAVNDIAEAKGECAVKVTNEKKSRKVSLRELETLSGNVNNDFVEHATESEVNRVKKEKRKTKREVSSEVTETAGIIDEDKEESKIKLVKNEKKLRKTVSLEQTASVGENNDIGAEELVVQTVIKEKKKSKKKKNRKKASVELDDKENKETAVVKKKVVKKKKKSNSIIVELIEDNMNSSKLDKNNMSIDSFHSAAGSPVKDTIIDDDNVVSKNNSVQAVIDTDAKLNFTLNQSTTLNNTFEREAKNKKKSSIKNSTFDKIENNCDTAELKDATFEKNNTSPQNSTFEKIEPKKKRLSKIETDTTFEKNSESPINTTFEKTVAKKKRMSKVGADTTFEKNSDNPLNATFEKTEAKNKRLSKVDADTTYEKNSESPLNTTFEKAEAKKKRLSKVDADTTFEKNSESPLNTTFEKVELKKRRSSKVGTNATFEKDNESPLNATFEKVEHKKRWSSKVGTTSDEQVASLNSTFDKTPNGQVSTTKSLDETFDKDNTKSNTTFDAEKANIDKTEKEVESDSKKSSLISSDASVNVTFDRSNDSRISITSDESRTENILNHTPVLIESSIDESRMSEDSNQTPEKPEVQAPVTPLKREGTFTKDGSDIMSPKRTERTPVKRNSLPSPGCTPFPFIKSSQKEKCMLNVTRSIEKSLRRSSLAEIVPRQTKVMFCSPVNNPAVVSQMKGKVIKSNLKGSNKSFVFDDDSGQQAARPASRKRSLTHGEAETRSKRKRLADELQHSVDRLSRPRTLSAAAKVPEPGTPSKKTATPSKAKPERARTKLPNFAALHQRQFDKMESLDECQQRRAKRAKQLLTPTGSVNIIERTSPKDTDTVQATKEPATKESSTKLLTPSKGPLENLNPGYTRFGFKLNIDANPFSVTSKKPEALAKEKRSNGVLRQTTCLALPSLAGTTASRRDVAKHSVMREKSFTEKRDVKRKETRTVIKGVRTNRRFELQMKMRNINA